MRAVKLCCRECSKCSIIRRDHKSVLAHSVSVVTTYTASDSRQHGKLSTERVCEFCIFLTIMNGFSPKVH